MKKRILPIICCSLQISAVRDPFVPTKITFTCVALGKARKDGSYRAEYFAVIRVKGTCKKVFLNDRVEGFEVMSITNEKVILKNELGSELVLTLRK